MIDLIFLVSGIVLMIIGIIGCFIPILPGPPLSYAGLLLLHFSKFGEFSFLFLVFFAVLTILVTVIDYLVPIWGTKRFGGSKAGMWGATIGVFLGLFFLPIGIIIGPFVGAIIGETISGKEFNKAVVAGLGSFIGFLLGTGLKLITSLLMMFFFVKEII